MLLRCESIDVSFGDVPILTDVSLDVRRGEVHVLIGPNGAGKTTLANVVTGHVRPAAGTVTFDGRALTGPCWRRARRGVGRKFQVARVFPRLDARQNLEMANRESSLKDINSEMQEIGAIKGEALSHGWRQWLELQMVLSQDPLLIVLDEPTAGLPRGERMRLADTLAEQRGVATLLVVEHDLDFVAQIADLVSFMHDGRLVRTGRFDEIRADRQVREVYLGAEAR